MNKHSFRTIFNAKRGMLMAVSEATTSNGKSAKGEGSGDGSGIGAAIGAMLLAALPMLVPLTAISQIIADPNAPRNQQAVILPAGNGVPIVNIQTPTAGGVSMNQFSQFNVNSNGAILNNGRLNTQTQLTGWIQANPHLATGSASVIVNQVNSNNPTLLNGYIEVAGQRAQVIIANPSGIQVNGAGFINAQSATLTTGTPNFNGNVITGYTVNQGTVQINGAGLHASTTDYTAILARAAQINAGIWAKNLDVVTGANQINVSSVGTTPTGISAATPTGAAPFFAIDVSSLGGMYAGKIMLIGTEAGLGAKNTGTIMGTNASLFAGAGEVTISVDGILSNSGRIQSDAGMTTTLGTTSVGGLNNTGTIYSGANSVVTTNGNVTNSGAIAAQGNLALTANGANSNINSTSTSTLAAGISASGTLGTPSSSTGNLQISATQSISANGQNLAAQNLSLSAQTINLSGSNTYANNINIAVSTGNLVIDNTNLTAGNLLALSTPTLLSTQNSNVSAAQLNFNAHDWDNSAGNVTHTGTGDLTVNLAGNITNAQGKIQANAFHTNLTAANLNNTDGLISGQAINLVTGANSSTQTLTNTNGTIYARQDLTVSSGGLGNNLGVMQSVGNLNVNTHNGNLTSNQGQIQSQQAITLNAGTGNIVSTQGLIRTAKDITITAASLDNSNTQGANQGIEAANITVSATSINNNLGAMRADMGAGLGSNLNLNSGGTITNSQGLLSSAGKLNITDTGNALAVTSTGGTMVSGDNLAVRAATLDNTNGFIVGQNVNLTTQALPAQTLTNTNGTIFSRADTVISSGSLGNDKGLIQAAGNLSINTNGATLTNTNSGAAGLLSGGTLNVQSSLIDNTAGRILTNGDINLTTTNLNNLQAGSIKTAGNLTLAVSSLTDNTGGTLSAAGALTLNQSGASLINNGGNISAGNGITLALQSLNNANGQIATTAGSNSDVNITANTLDNTNGKIGSDRDITITAPNWVGSSTGAGYGTVIANRDLSITTTGDHVLGTPAFASNRDLSFTTTGTLSNSNTVQAVRNLSLNASDITNTGNIYAGELLKAKASGSITNSGSMIGGEVNLAAVGNITNTGTSALIGATNSSGALTLSAANVINTDDVTATDTSATTTIYGAGAVNITATSAIINRSALIESGGDMTLTAGIITNTRRTLTMSGVFDQSVDPAVISALNISMSGTTGQTNVHNASSIGGVYIEPPHGGRMNSDYFYTAYTGVASQNSVLTVSPKAQIISGGNLTPNSPLFQNYWSQVAATGNVNISGVTLDQDGFKGAPVSQIKVAYSGTYNYRTYRSEPWTHSFCDSGCDAAGDNRYYTASTYDSSFTSLGSITGTGASINNGARNSTSLASQGLNYAITTSGNQNAASASTAISAPARAGSVPLPALLTNIRVPSGGLFAPTTRVGATYLIESNPKLTDYRQWLSSDYLLSALSFDPQITQKRLGDGFYEQRLIRDQVSQLTGQRFLSGYQTEEEEYKALMDSAVTASKQFNLRPGVALTVEQVAQLTSDIVWLVETEVTLPNGSKVKALAPQVYLSKLSAKNIRADGNLIAAAGDIDLKDLKGFTNAGTLTAGGNLALQTNGTLNNAFGTLSSGRMMTLAADKDIDLTSSTVRASALSLTAGQDIILATATQTSQSTSRAAPQGGAGFGGLLGAAPASNSFSRTTIGQTANIQVTGDTSITTGRNFNIAGATLATGGNLNVSTGGSWNIGAVQANEAKTTNSFGGTQSSNFTTNQGSTITIGGNTKANVGGDLNVSGSTLNLGKNASSTAVIAVAGNVSITAVKDTAKVDSSYNAGKASGTYNTFDETVKGSALNSTGSLTLTAGKDLTVIGSNINAAGNTNLGAGGNVTIAAERETHTLDAEDKGSKGGLGGKSETKTTSQNLDIIQSGVSGANVSIVSANGNVILEAAKIEATNNLNVSAINGAVALLSATSQSYFQQDKKESNVAVQRNSGSGNFDKNVVTTQLKYGTLAIDTNKIIADLPASKAADELAKQPGMAWITQLQNDPTLAGKIDWKKIDEAHKEWAYDKTTMTPAMASLVTIALAVATGGTGAGLVGATAGSMGAAAASAAFTSLVTQATIGLINNGGDLGKTLQQLGSSESIRGLVTSMATAAAMSYVNNMDFMKDMTTDKITGQPIKFADLEFTQKLGVSVTNAATGAVTRTALNGGSLGDALVTAIGSGFTTALAAQGANALHLSPSQQGDLMAQVGNKLGHALIGCAAAKANSAGNNCQAGAMGAVIGETAAELLAKTPAEVDAMDAKQKQAYESSLVNTTKLISASIAAAAGLDPNAAAVASSNAVENNFLSTPKLVARNAALNTLRDAKGQNFFVGLLKPVTGVQDAAQTLLVLNAIDQRSDALLTAWRADPKSLSTAEKNELAIYIADYAKSEGADAAKQLLAQGVGQKLDNADVGSLTGYAKSLRNVNAIQEGQAAIGTPAITALPGGVGAVVRAVLAMQGSGQIAAGAGQVLDGDAGGLLDIGLGLLNVAPLAIGTSNAVRTSTAATAKAEAEAIAKAKIENNFHADDNLTTGLVPAERVNKAFTDKGDLPPFTEGTYVNVNVAKPNQNANMVVTSGQVDAIVSGKPAIGAFSTPDPVTSAADARTNLAITPKMKPIDDTLLVQPVTTTGKPVVTIEGKIAPQEPVQTYPGGGNQTYYDYPAGGVRTDYVKPAGPAVVLPPK